MAYYSAILLSNQAEGTPLDLFSASGDNRSFVGLQGGKISYIFFIEAKFGDIYGHGSK